MTGNGDGDIQINGTKRKDDNSDEIEGLAGVVDTNWKASCVNGPLHGGRDTAGLPRSSQSMTLQEIRCNNIGVYQKHNLKIDTSFS